MLAAKQASCADLPSYNRLALIGRDADVFWLSSLLRFSSYRMCVMEDNEEQNPLLPSR